jgi:FAD/FMN-containing dehydrogenase
LHVDPDRRLARVQPGTVLDDLRTAAERHHLTYGPDPATHNRCTLGGMIGNNSCGVHSVMAGMTADNVEELEVLTYDGLRLRVGATMEAELERIVRAGGRRGEIYARLEAVRHRYAELIRARFPDIPRRVSGYNLPALLPENGFHLARALVGSEGTCVTVLEATVRLVHSPPTRVVVALGYSDLATGCDRVPRSSPIGRWASRASTIGLSTTCAARACGRPTWRCCRTAAAGFWWSSAATRATTPRARPAN